MSSSMNVATGLSSRTPMPSTSSTSTSSMGRHPLLSRGGGNLAADVTVAGHVPRRSGQSDFESIECRWAKTRRQYMTPRSEKRDTLPNHVRHLRHAVATEAAFVINELVKPASVIASHANEEATRSEEHTSDPSQ